MKCSSMTKICNGITGDKGSRKRCLHIKIKEIKKSINNALYNTKNDDSLSS